MSSDTVLSSFALNIQKVLEEAIATKSKELDEREKIVAKREKIVDHILENDNTKGQVTIQVGNQEFITTAGILKSVKDSFFCGLLNPQFASGESKNHFFIPRDPKIFEYVLEYLTYGTLFSEVPTDGLLLKLAADADFYLLPDLKKQVEMRIKQKSDSSPRGNKVCSYFM